MSDFCQSGAQPGCSWHQVSSFLSIGYWFSF
jgi:hypothetical protein